MVALFAEAAALATINAVSCPLNEPNAGHGCKTPGPAGFNSIRPTEPDTFAGTFTIFNPFSPMPNVGKDTLPVADLAVVYSALFLHVNDAEPLFARVVVSAASNHAKQFGKLKGLTG